MITLAYLDHAAEVQKSGNTILFDSLMNKGRLFALVLGGVKLEQNEISEVDFTEKEKRLLLAFQGVGLAKDAYQRHQFDKDTLVKLSTSRALIKAYGKLSMFGYTDSKISHMAYGGYNYLAENFSDNPDVLLLGAGLKGFAPNEKSDNTLAMTMLDNFLDGYKDRKSGKGPFVSYLWALMSYSELKLDEISLNLSSVASGKQVISDNAEISNAQGEFSKLSEALTVLSSCEDWRLIADIKHSNPASAGKILIKDESYRKVLYVYALKYLNMVSSVVDLFDKNLNKPNIPKDVALMMKMRLDKYILIADAISAIINGKEVEFTEDTHELIKILADNKNIFEGNSMSSTLGANYKLDLEGAVSRYSVLKSTLGISAEKHTAQFNKLMQILDQFGITIKVSDGDKQKLLFVLADDDLSRLVNVYEIADYLSLAADVMSKNILSVEEKQSLSAVFDLLMQTYDHMVSIQEPTGRKLPVPEMTKFGRIQEYGLDEAGVKYVGPGPDLGASYKTAGALIKMKQFEKAEQILKNIMEYETSRTVAKHAFKEIQGIDNANSEAIREELKAKGILDENYSLVKTRDLKKLGLDLGLSGEYKSYNEQIISILQHTGEIAMFATSLDLGFLQIKDAPFSDELKSYFETRKAQSLEILTNLCNAKGYFPEWIKIKISKDDAGTYNVSLADVKAGESASADYMGYGGYSITPTTLLTGRDKIADMKEGYLLVGRRNKEQLSKIFENKYSLEGFYSRIPYRMFGIEEGAELQDRFIQAPYDLLRESMILAGKDISGVKTQDVTPDKVPTAPNPVVKPTEGVVKPEAEKSQVDALLEKMNNDPIVSKEVKGDVIDNSELDFALINEFVSVDVVAKIKEVYLSLYKGDELKKDQISLEHASKFVDQILVLLGDVNQQFSALNLKFAKYEQEYNKLSIDNQVHVKQKYKKMNQNISVLRSSFSSIINQLSMLNAEIMKSSTGEDISRYVLREVQLGLSLKDGDNATKSAIGEMLIDYYMNETFAQLTLNNWTVMKSSISTFSANFEKIKHLFKNDDMNPDVLVFKDSVTKEQLTKLTEIGVPEALIVILQKSYTNKTQIFNDFLKNNINIRYIANIGNTTGKLVVVGAMTDKQLTELKSIFSSESDNKTLDSLKKRDAFENIILYFENKGLSSKETINKFRKELDASFKTGGNAFFDRSLMMSRYADFQLLSAARDADESSLRNFFLNYSKAVIMSNRMYGMVVSDKTEEIDNKNKLCEELLPIYQDLLAKIDKTIDDKTLAKKLTEDINTRLIEVRTNSLFSGKDLSGEEQANIRNDYYFNSKEQAEMQSIIVQASEGKYYQESMIRALIFFAEAGNMQGTIDGQILMKEFLRKTDEYLKGEIDKSKTYEFKIPIYKLKLSTENDDGLQLTKDLFTIKISPKLDIKKSEKYSYNADTGDLTIIAMTEDEQKELVKLFTGEDLLKVEELIKKYKNVSKTCKLPINGIINQKEYEILLKTFKLTDVSDVNALNKFMASYQIVKDKDDVTLKIPGYVLYDFIQNNGAGYLRSR